MEKRIQYNNCSCDEGSSDSRNEFINKIKGKQGEIGKQGEKGPSGLDNLVVASQIGTSGNEVTGNDVAIDDAALAALKTDGFDPKAKATLKVTKDESNLTFTKWWVRFSNSFLSYQASFIPRVFKAGGTAGQVPVKINNTDFNWSWQDVTALIKSDYYTPSTTNNNFQLGSATFAVELGLKYYPNMICAVTKSDDPTKYLTGIVTAYNPTTGSLTIDIKAFSGTGSHNNWIINVGFTPFLPAMANNAGKYLCNDGLNPFWGTPQAYKPGDLIPSFRATPELGVLLLDGSTYTYDPTLPPSPSNPYRQLCINIGRETVGSNFGKDAGGSPLASNQFRLTDARGRGPIGAGGSLLITALNTVGGIGGEALHTLTDAETPLRAHTHTLNDGTDNPASGAGYVVTSVGAGGPGGATTDANTALTATGHNNIQPSFGVNWYIAY